MIEFNEIYKANNELDDMFIKKYDHVDLVRKNKIELLVEIGELANETKCFKYWSSKKADMSLVEMEYADCVIMTLCFFNLLKIKLDDQFPEITDNLDDISIFAKIYSLASNFYYQEDASIIKELFVYLLKLGYHLGFNNDDIKRICMKKINCDKERFREDY